MSNENPLEKLDQCHPDLQILFREVIKKFPCKVTTGFRNQQDQDKAYALGTSQLKWPNGKHNQNPSIAADVYPTPIDWNNLDRIYLFSGFVIGIASRLLEEGKITHKIRWGGDWNDDTQVKDNTFNDLGHFELIINE